MILNDFTLYALVCGIAASISLSSIGCLVLWKRMTFLGDAIAHSATLGVVIGVILGIDIIYTISIISILFVFLIIHLRKNHTSDTLIAMLSHGFLAISLLAIACMKTIKVDIMSYLFGDLLIVNDSDIKLIIGISVLVLIWLKFRWKNLLSAAINEDLAKVEGINTKQLEIEFMLIVAILVSISIKIIGILLLSSMLITPAAAARNFSSSPKQMVIYSIFIGVIATTSGIMLSAIFDFPSGPAIVVSAITIYVFSLLQQSK